MIEIHPPGMPEEEILKQKLLTTKVVALLTAETASQSDAIGVGLSLLGSVLACCRDRDVRFSIFKEITGKLIEGYQTIELADEANRKGGHA